MDCAKCDDCMFDGSNTLKNLFEIHVTVETTDVPLFKKLCDDNGVKAIVIEYQNRLTGAYETQVMTSYKIKSNVDQIYTIKDNIVSFLKIGGLYVVREKIETTLETDIPALYYECHIPVIVANDTLFSLKKVVRGIGDIHLSKNAFKKIGNEYVLMATIRSYGDVEAFKYKVEFAKRMLSYANFQTERVVMEKCIFDDNVKNDDRWLKGKY